MAPTLASVVLFSSHAVHRTERMFRRPTPTMAPAAIHRTPGPPPMRLRRYSAKIMAMAPSADGRMTTSCVHPKRNATLGPYVSRRKT